MAFTYSRTIHFPDTDAAGVVFFARYLSIAHEGYEEALQAAGIDLNTFFSDHDVVVPIARSEASYLRPLSCGDKITVEITPRRLSENSFAIDYVLKRITPPAKRAAVIRTEHVCIGSTSRERCALPTDLARWVDGAAGDS